MKVLVTTIVALNPGDAAILQGSVVLLRGALGADTHVAAVDTQAQAAAGLYPWMRFVPSLFGARKRRGIARRIAAWGYEHRLRRYDAWRFRTAGRAMQGGLTPLAALLTSADERAIIREYLAADLVVASGGTYLVPAYDMEPALRDYEFTLALGRHFAFMQQSMGPFTASRLAPRFRAVFTHARFVLVRDPRSRSHVTALGVHESLVRVVPDAAFALARHGAHAAAAATLSPPDGSRPLRVAISVREWKRFADDADGRAEQRYLQGVADLAAWFVTTHGAEVTFLSSCQGIPDYWTDDARTAARAAALLPPEVAARIPVDGQFRGPEELRDTLATFDVIVATRMHVAILALCVGRPVLPIAYEFKTTELFGALGLPDLVTQIEDADGATLIARATLLLKDWDRLVTTSHRGVESLITKLDAADACLAEATQHR